MLCTSSKPRPWGYYLLYTHPDINTNIKLRGMILYSVQGLFIVTHFWQGVLRVYRPVQDKGHSVIQRVTYAGP